MKDLLDLLKLLEDTKAHTTPSRIHQTLDLIEPRIEILKSLEFYQTVLKLLPTHFPKLNQLHSRLAQDFPSYDTNTLFWLKGLVVAAHQDAVHLQLLTFVAGQELSFHVISCPTTRLILACLHIDAL